MPTRTSTPHVIASVEDLRSFLSSIPESSTLYLDLEGKNLGRHGTLTILTILVKPTNKTVLIDIQTLGDAAFTTTPDDDGKTTLKHILEDPTVLKCLWDVRNDADALWSHHGVRLAGVLDVQLLENAARRGGAADKTRLRGLGVCVERDLPALRAAERRRWTRTKRDFGARMKKNAGGGGDVFSRRPLDAATARYCAGDVAHLPALRDVYAAGLDAKWVERVRVESARRVDEACRPGFQSKGEDKTLGPWGSGKS